MARECQDASRSLSVATKDANGSSSDSNRNNGEPQLAGGAGMARASPHCDESRQAGADPSLERDRPSSSAGDEQGRRGSGSAEAGLPSKASPQSSSSSSDSELKETEGGDFSLAGAVCATKTKELASSLSAEGPIVISAKRRLWDVDREQVNEYLKSELKICQEESMVKSYKWNFDFEKEVPLRGAWKWEVESKAPEFYKPKECSGKKSYTQKRFSPYGRPATGPLSTPQSSLVTSSSSSSSSSSSVMPPSGSFVFTKDYFKQGVQTSAKAVEATAAPSSVQEQPPSTEIPSTTTCLSTTLSRTTDIISTTVIRTTTSSTVTEIQPSVTISSPCSRLQGNSGSETVATIRPTQFYPPPSSSSSREPDDRGTTRPSSSSSDTQRTSKEPDRKKSKTSQSSSSSGTSSTSGNKSSPSPLLKYYR